MRTRTRPGGERRGGAGPLRRRPPSPGERRLSVAEAEFYAQVYDPARRGSLAELRRRGCDEHEAEELFAASYAKVMEAIDPIERCFSAPQMVRFVKRACCRRLIDEGRHRAQLVKPAARPPRLAPESTAEAPGELAEEREAVAIGPEALATLSGRDRLVFTLRHLQGMEPGEIVAEVPGLSLRTYRKVIQRANARVLEAYARIEAGERCAEMEDALLRRYLAGESNAAERTVIEAHLAHCRACQQARARMREYLIDVASGVLLASSLGAGRAGAVPARLLELASQGAQALGEASRAARERLREVLLRLAGALPGSGADASVSQALGASSWRVASACTAAIAAGACVAAGVVPGVVDLPVPHRHKSPPARQASAESAPPVADPSEYTAPVQTTATSQQEGSGASAKRAAPAKRKTTSASRKASSTAAPASGQQVATEFGPESSQPAPPSGSSSPSSSSSQGTSVSSATAAKGGGSGSGGGSTGTTQSSSEFGL
jgi:DNA-directed RNA polymerase specialized sigma24 family protein/anti-sigma factor RsiW